MNNTYIHIYLFLFCFSYSGQESSARQQGGHSMVQEWSAAAAAADLARTSHQDTKGCYRREIRI